MRIELTARFVNKRRKTDEDLAYEKAQAIIDPDFEPENGLEIYYDPINVNIDDIADYMRFDRQHTQLILDGGRTYVVRVPYISFRQIYEQLTGNMTSVVEYSDSPQPIRRESHDRQIDEFTRENEE